MLNRILNILAPLIIFVLLVIGAIFVFKMTGGNQGVDEMSSDLGATKSVRIISVSSRNLSVGDSVSVVTQNLLLGDQVYFVPQSFREKDLSRFRPVKVIDELLMTADAPYEYFSFNIPSEIYSIPPQCPKEIIEKENGKFCPQFALPPPLPVRSGQYLIGISRDKKPIAPDSFVSVVIEA